jgi:hypothetical protein
MHSIHLVNSKITTSVKAGAGDGGDINIDPVFVVLDASDILANAHDGNGGDIEIITNHLIKTPDSVIKASSVKGVDGRIQINAPDSQINGELSSAPIEFLNAAAILPQPCSARVGDDTIRLVHKHRLRADSPYALRVHLPIHQDESRSTHSVVDLAHIPKLQTYTKQPWECNADG